MVGGPLAGGWKVVDILRRCQARSPRVPSRRAVGAGFCIEGLEAEDLLLKSKLKCEIGAAVGVEGGSRHCTAELAAITLADGRRPPEGVRGRAGPDRTSSSSAWYKLSRSEGDVADLSRE